MYRRSEMALVHLKLEIRSLFLLPLMKAICIPWVRTGEQKPDRAIGRDHSQHAGRDFCRGRFGYCRSVQP